MQFSGIREIKVYARVGGTGEPTDLVRAVLADQEHRIDQLMTYIGDRALLCWTDECSLSFRCLWLRSFRI